MASKKILGLAVALAVCAQSAEAQSALQPASVNSGAIVQHSQPTFGLFVRFTPQARTSRQEERLSFGAGLWQNEAATRQGLEMRFSTTDPSLWRVGSENQQLATFANYQWQISGNDPQQLGIDSKGKTLLVGGAIVVGLALISALSRNNKSTLCPDNTVPNPLSGKCEPLKL